jgi:hypothetical protein
VVPEVPARTAATAQTAETENKAVGRFPVSRSGAEADLAAAEMGAEAATLDVGETRVTVAQAAL